MLFVEKRCQNYCLPEGFVISEDLIYEYRKNVIFMNLLQLLSHFGIVFIIKLASCTTLEDEYY